MTAQPASALRLRTTVDQHRGTHQTGMVQRALHTVETDYTTALAEHPATGRDVPVGDVWELLSDEDRAWWTDTVAAIHAERVAIAGLEPDLRQAATAEAQARGIEDCDLEDEPAVYRAAREAVLAADAAYDAEAAARAYVAACAEISDAAALPLEAVDRMAVSDDDLDEIQGREADHFLCARFADAFLAALEDVLAAAAPQPVVGLVDLMERLQGEPARGAETWREYPVGDHYARLCGLPTAHGEIDWTSLPTFGGTEPRDTTGVWSWDETHLLVGYTQRDLQIVSRAGWTGEQDDAEALG